MGGVGALRVLLGLFQLLIGLILLSPVASITGFTSGRTLANLSVPAALMVLAFTAPALWMLALAVFSFRGLTPWSATALRWTNIAALAGAVLHGLGGLLALQAAARSAERGGGLLGAFGLMPITLGIALGGLALASLWLLRAVKRTSAARSRR
jgi:hypothetical protein